MLKRLERAMGTAPFLLPVTQLVDQGPFEARLFQREEACKASDAALATIKAADVKVSDLDAGERWRISRRLEQVVGQIASNVGLPVWIEVTSTLNDTRSQKKPGPMP